MNAKNNIHLSYRSEIDGLRAFAVLSVVIFHAFPNFLKGGFVGVDIFFVISGFLITRHIFQKIDIKEFSFFDFYSRRIKRIFPALIVVMLSSLVFGWFVLLPDEYSQLAKHIASGAVFISNFVFSSEFGYFDANSELKPMLHLWSLSIEEQFYIIWPILLCIAVRLKVSLLFITLTLLGASFLHNIFYIEKAPTETFFWPFGRFWELLCGSILAWFMVPKTNVLKTRSRKPAFLNFFAKIVINKNLISILGISLLLFSVFFINKSDPFPSYITLLPIFGTMLVIIGGANNAFAKLLLTNPIATWFGLISYPLYLWHWPILSYLKIVKDDLTLHRDVIFFAILLSIFLAWITYKYIEKPIRFKSYKEPLRTLILFCLVLLLGLCGFFISIKAIEDERKIYLREGREHFIGSTARWFEGKNNWLFLGNANDKTLEKLKLTKKPKIDEVKDLEKIFLEISKVLKPLKTKMVLLIGPNKSSVYDEHLPSEIIVSSTRYIDYFLNELKKNPYLMIYDPTNDLKNLKSSVGLLYYRTDSHWNQKGAFYAFRNLMKNLDLSVPDVDFVLADSWSGGLIDMAGLDSYPLINDDNWKEIIKHDYKLKKKTFSFSNNLEFETFGQKELVINSNPVEDKKIWVIGDSFTKALRPYLNATFSEVKYLGHWRNYLHKLGDDLQNIPEKPDLVICIRVERSF